MTPEQLEARLYKLITYTKQLASQHNALEQKVAELEADPLSVPVKTLSDFEVDE